ncbi:MAG: hypothetical protein AB8G18_13105 [Gammaproteobacteria bacterium]
MREQQLPLHLKLPDSTTFESYFAGPNQEALAYLVNGDVTMTWLWGESSSGKTHLLQSVAAASDQAVYLPLAELKPYGPFVLDGYDAFDVVCLDQLDAIIPPQDQNTASLEQADRRGVQHVISDGGSTAFEVEPDDQHNAESEDTEFDRALQAPLSLATQRLWEKALFKLYQEVVVERQNTLVVASKSAPKNSLFLLPDLESRLLSGPVFRLQSLDDDQLLSAIQLRASRRGLKLPDATGRYLLRRMKRDMHSLCEFLDRLDTASLVHQSKLTIALVKTTLG